MSVKKERLIRRGMVVAMAIFVTAFGTVMVQAVIKIANTENTQVEEDYTPTEGGTATPVSSSSTDNSSTDVETPKADYVPPSSSDYDFEISSRVTSDEAHPDNKNLFYFEAKKVSDSPLAIEFTFATRDSFSYYMRPNLHFSINQNGEKYRPKSVEILEVFGLDEEYNLASNGNGMMRAVLTFEDVDPSKQFYFVYNNYRQTGSRGFAIRFDNDSEVANNPNEVQSKKPDYLSLSKSDFDFEFSSKITSEETPEKEFMYYEAKKVGDNPLAIEFTFAPREEYTSYYMKPKLHFYIKQNDEKYKPKSVEVLEVVGLDEDHYLIADDGGKMRAVLTFEGVDLSKEFYFVYDNYQHTGRGYAIRFDN